MTRISTEQIVEILDDAPDSISIRKHDLFENVFVVSTHARNGDELDREKGTDIGELVNELHTRL